MSRTLFRPLLGRATVARLALGFTAGVALPLCTASPTLAQAASASSAIKIPFQKYTLPNGLTVVLAEDHATPTVAVEMMYHVGSKNEQVGRTGFAHLFEHVMFTGSGHVPYGLHDRYTEGVGGSNNGSTSNDITMYYETIPSNYLETALWLESDRMGWLLDALDTAKYNAQRDIVKNERRQRIDNQPYGRVEEIMSAAIYPPNNPYHWPVVGSMADLSAASIEDVKAFFRKYYAPNNSTLVVTGDFEPAQAKQWVARYFDGIKRGTPITRPKLTPVHLTREKRFVYEDRVQVARLFVEWPTIGSHNDDQFALDVLADILAGSRTARLTKDLVYDKQWAASVNADQNTNEDAGEFQVSITPRPGHSLTELEAEADSVIGRLKRDGPTEDELKRSKAGLQLEFVAGLESNLGKAVRLAFGQTFYNDPGEPFTTEFQKYQRVTTADVRRVANKYLTQGRVVLSAVPLGKKDEASKPQASAPAVDPFMTTPQPSGENK